MSIGPIRPRFRAVARGSIADNIARFEQAVGDPQSQCVMRVLGSHVDITVDASIRHRWSPCVQMELEEADPEDQPSDDQPATVVRGLVGPHPNTWTMFAFTNLAICVIGAFALMAALAQLTLGHTPWTLWVALACLLGLGAMYIASQVGRRLAAEQTQNLMHLVRSALDLRDIT